MLEVLRQQLRDRQTDQVRQREAGTQPPVRLDDTGQRDTDRTQPSEVEVKVGRTGRGIERARNQREVGVLVGRHFRVTGPATGQVTDDRARPSGPQVDPGDKAALTREPESTGRPAGPCRRSADALDHSEFDEVLEYGTHRRPRQAGRLTDHTDRARLIGLGQHPQTRDLIRRPLRLNGLPCSVHRGVHRPHPLMETDFNKYGIGMGGWGQGWLGTVGRGWGLGERWGRSTCHPKPQSGDDAQDHLAGESGPVEKLARAFRLAEVEDRVDDRAHVVGSQQTGQGLAHSGVEGVQFVGLAAAEGGADQLYPAGGERFEVEVGMCSGEPSDLHDPGAGSGGSEEACEDGTAQVVEADVEGVGAQCRRDVLGSRVDDPGGAQLA